MKKTIKTKVLISKLTVAGVFALGSSLVMADADLNVGANVQAVCYFSSPSYSLDFGTLNPANSTDANASVNVTYWCTSGMTSTLQADQGQYYSGGARHMSGMGGTRLLIH